MDVRDKIKQQATGKLRVTVNAKALRDIIERAERVELVAWQMSNCIYNAKQISSWEGVLGKLVDLQTQFDAIHALAPATTKEPT